MSASGSIVKLQRISNIVLAYSPWRTVTIILNDVLKIKSIFISLKYPRWSHALRYIIEDFRIVTEHTKIIGFLIVPRGLERAGHLRF